MRGGHEQIVKELRRLVIRIKKSETVKEFEVYVGYVSRIGSVEDGEGVKDYTLEGVVEGEKRVDC